MLLAYTLGLIQVTQRFRAIVVGATGAIALLYLVSVRTRLLPRRRAVSLNREPAEHRRVAGDHRVAALNLVLDFDLIETGVAQGAPRYMEWYAAFGLLVTLVWLYLEILRFLSKVRQR